uniref:DUF834 domain-containing protein n=1 Tax=Oryza meridionalis TaxID=40149 RepID=A0A0E0E2P1_9ORYZ
MTTGDDHGAATTNGGGRRRRTEEGDEGMAPMIFGLDEEADTGGLGAVDLTTMMTGSTSSWQGTATGGRRQRRGDVPGVFA